MICDSTSIDDRPTRAACTLSGRTIEVRVLQFHVGIDVLGLGLLDDVADLRGQFAEHVQIGPEDFDLDGRGHAGEVVDLVFDEGLELDRAAQLGNRRLQRACGGRRGSARRCVCAGRTA